MLAAAAIRRGSIRRATASDCAERRAKYSIGPEGDDCEVEPGHRQEVSEAAPGEGIRGGDVHATTVAGADGTNEPGLASRERRRGCLGEPVARGLDRREPGGRRDDGPGARWRTLRRGHRGAPARGPIATAGVALPLRCPNPPVEADGVAVRERPRQGWCADLEEGAIAAPEEEANPVAEPFRDGVDPPFEDAARRGSPRLRWLAPRRAAHPAGAGEADGRERGRDRDEQAERGGRQRGPRDRQCRTEPEPHGDRQERPTNQTAHRRKQ